MIQLVKGGKDGLFSLKTRRESRALVLALLASEIPTVGPALKRERAATFPSPPGSWNFA
ncbi:hypothetical protein [Hartmannibacter diazotrophicus]|uniref:hypothetical protein n=1 Tax=Hartmannibacter diazotrophicus TaxID=1482074 RepID=UPI0012FD1F1E|nr:hypothetical protein [Hartmannibacter diazotrophicus]